MNMQDMEGYKELMDKLLDTLPAEQVLSHYGPEQPLAGLRPEQRLAGERARVVAAGDHDRRLGVGHADLRAQLDHEPLRRALADPRHRLEASRVPGGDRPDTPARVGRGRRRVSPAG